MTPMDLAAARVAQFAELLADVGRSASSQLTGLSSPLGWRTSGWVMRVVVVGEVEGVAALVAEEVAVDAGLVAVVAADDLAAVGGGAHAEGGLAAVAAVRADGGDVVHLPRARLVAIGAGGQRADGAGVDAHAALLAVDMREVVGRDARRGCSAR